MVNLAIGLAGMGIFVLLSGSIALIWLYAELREAKSKRSPQLKLFGGEKVNIADTRELAGVGHGDH